MPQMQQPTKITRGLRKDQLVKSLENTIDRFHDERKSVNSRQSVEKFLTDSLRDGFANHLLFPLDWVAGVRRVYSNSESKLSSNDQEILFNLFATFTADDDLLRNILKSVIRMAHDEDMVEDNLEDTGHPEQSEKLDGKSYEDDDPSGERTKPWQNWQEWIGRKILEAAPHLVSPKAVSNVSQPIDVSQSILNLAVVNDADWVIPSDLSKLTAGHRDRVKQLLKAGTPNETLLETAVKLGYLKTVGKLVKLLDSCGINQDNRGSLLHIAITSKKPDSMEITKLLVETFPNIIDQMPNDQSALQILRSSGLIAHRNELEDFLVSKIIRRKPPSLVRKLLYDQNSQSKELYVNLSFFNDERHNFNSFLSRLVESKFKVEFYSTLMYVELPRLRENTEEAKREEAFVVLNWLRTRSVHTILELHVPDALHTPHRDEDIEVGLGLAPGLELEGFREIETLNWEKLDLSLESLKKVKGLRKVYLYSENWNTLGFWTGTEGLSSKDYANITDIAILVVKNNISQERAEFYRDKALARLEERKTEIREAENILEKGQKPREFRFTVDIHVWKSGDPERGPVKAPGKKSMTPKEVTDLEQFLRQDPRPDIPLQSLHGSGLWPHPVRVAIIDNGIDASISKIWDRVAASRSFVEVDQVNGTREASWWIPSDPHGTQMASIIVDIDPRCQLYIAKVGTGRENQVNRDCVYDALEWVTDVEHVDIVVMCMTYTEEDEEIAKLIKKAHNDGKGTLFFCSTEDMGKTSRKVYPASMDQTFAISACTRAGKEGETTDPSANYYFQGEEIHADCLSYWTCQPEPASGSSVATAIAAGVASLILSCRFYADKERKSKRTRKETIELAFEAMKEQKEDKYVAPGRLFKEEQEDAVPWPTVQWRTWVHNKFGPGKQYG